MERHPHVRVTPFSKPTIIRTLVSKPTIPRTLVSKSTIPRTGTLVSTAECPPTLSCLIVFLSKTPGMPSNVLEEGAFACLADRYCFDHPPTSVQPPHA